MTPQKLQIHEDNYNMILENLFFQPEEHEADQEINYSSQANEEELGGTYLMHMKHTRVTDTQEGHKRKEQERSRGRGTQRNLRQAEQSQQVFSGGASLHYSRIFDQHSDHHSKFTGTKLMSWMSIRQFSSIHNFFNSLSKIFSFQMVRPHNFFGTNKPEDTEDAVQPKILSNCLASIVRRDVSTFRKESGERTSGKKRESASDRDFSPPLLQPPSRPPLHGYICGKCHHICGTP
ncbi:hypothetical protein P5673_003681 [Acropora cervicornis]|uniref:Uncharacterized protein n=1 Tax=Acropora cervicornis TaxID=6130 RepID=A0AAD9R1L2_ACRCE|nr:hypothetical protein P5673_003681 [Acropora cervicornis]